jgi:hypothetical protein
MMALLMLVIPMDFVITLCDGIAYVSDSDGSRSENIAGDPESSTILLLVTTTGPGQITDEVSLCGWKGAKYNLELIHPHARGEIIRANYRKLINAKTI